ncbi:hypothetical protein K3495_g7759 [Podosphaera aphanis]|nr:hypothetical protein K3495_g7759 [Podosphaera aphanis]
MVSFSCEGCGDILTKKKLDSHKNQCYGASFTCLDCMVNFPAFEYRSHTSCITEAQKYQGALYRPEKEKKPKPNTAKPQVPTIANANERNTSSNDSAIVQSFTNNSSEMATMKPNIFDFLVNKGEIPHLNNNLPEPMQISDDTPDILPEQNGHDVSKSLVRMLIQDQPNIASDQKIATPLSAPKREKQRREKKDRTTESTDKKRKRLHVETKAHNSRDIDETMIDAPPPMPHSGLTGGLINLMSRNVHHPRMLDYPGDKTGIAREISPGSPIKKSKHATSRGNAITMSNSRPLVTPRPPRQHTEEWSKRRIPKHRPAPDHQKPKLIGYKPPDGGTPAVCHDGKQMVMFKPPAARPEILLNLIRKGPESERGISLNKALKQYHRERQTTSFGICKAAEEKELLRCLRMKRNADGEVVIFLG